MRVKRLAQEHDTMSMAKVQTWGTHSRVKHANHENCASHKTVLKDLYVFCKLLVKFSILP